MKCDAQNFIGNNIGHTARSFKYFFSILLKDYHLSFEQSVILFIISKYPHASINYIAKELDKNKATISREFNTLVKREFCIKTTNSDDKRSVSLELTPKGKECLERIEKTLIKAEEFVREAFTPEEITMFISMLERARERLKKFHEDNP